MPLDGIVAMTDAEKEVTLNLNSDTITKFTVDNFNTYNRLRVMEAFPRIFGSQAPNWLKYSHSGLVDISYIDMDNKQFEQAARVNVNPKMPEMRLDFKFNFSSTFDNLRSNKAVIKGSLYQPGEKD